MSTLSKAVDPDKDQSYFLFGLTQKALQRTLMPLGGIPKAMVRKLANEFKLAVADKEDSMEICFIGSEGYKKFVEERSPETLRLSGVLTTKDGFTVGEHEGMHRYTIGQRKGLNIQGKDKKKFYVIGMDGPRNNVIVGSEKDLYRRQVLATKVNWIKPIEGIKGIRCKAKIRSRHEEARCMVTAFENDTVRVDFDEMQRAITPGQAIVFYEDDEVLGGGFIEKTLDVFEDVDSEQTS